MLAQYFRQLVHDWPARRLRLQYCELARTSRPCFNQQLHRQESITGCISEHGVQSQKNKETSRSGRVRAARRPEHPRA